MHINQLLFSIYRIARPWEESHYASKVSTLVYNIYSTLQEAECYCLSVAKRQYGLIWYPKMTNLDVFNMSFWKLLCFLWVINLPQLYALYLAGFNHLSAPPRAQPWCRMMRVRKMQWRTFPSLSSPPPYAPQSHTRHWYKPA